MDKDKFLGQGFLSIFMFVNAIIVLFFFIFMLRFALEFSADRRFDILGLEFSLSKKIEKPEEALPVFRKGL